MATHHATRSSAMLIAIVALAGCTDADTFIPFPEFGGPAGIITGTVTYLGPPPCTANGRVLGAAILLAFDERALPPPEGLGTSPVGLNTVNGEELFRGIRSELAFEESGALLCPPAGAASVSVSADLSMGPLPAGVFEIRGFYDYDGDFNPGFSIFNLPTAGDVGGGAIENVPAVLQGAAVEYRRIPVGTLQADGTRVMPETGVKVEGVVATLGLPLPLERPLFHVREVRDDQFGNTDPSHVVVPSDYPLALFDLMDPMTTESSFVRLVLGAGVAPDEIDAASGSPFRFPTENPFILHRRQDVNRDGMIDQRDSILESSSIPALRPLVLLTKIGPDGASQQQPVILWQGVTLLDSLFGTATAPLDLLEPRPELLLALRPSLLCIDPSNPTKKGVLVNTHPADGAGTPLITDPAPIEAALSAQFGRPIEVQVGCLPQGLYNMNIVYETGQAWTVPNEAGSCSPTEPPSADGLRCGSRPRLPSQSVVVTIGPPQDASYCAANPTPDECVATE